MMIRTSVGDHVCNQSSKIRPTLYCLQAFRRNSSFLVLVFMGGRSLDWRRFTGSVTAVNRSRNLRSLHRRHRGCESRVCSKKLSSRERAACFTKKKTFWLKFVTPKIVLLRVLEKLGDRVSELNDFVEE